MKVLILSIYHPELLRGGAQRVAYELFEGLKAAPGVDPVLLAAIDPSFTSLYKAGARITGFDGRPGEFLFLSRAYDYIWHKTTAPLLLEAYAAFLAEVQPDVVHFHHFLLFGIDLLTFTRRVLPKARIVFTLHEFLGICAADGHMVRTRDKTLCTRASAVRCHQCFPQYTPEHFFLREMWFKRHFEVVDQFTSPSRFMIEHYVDWGLDRSRITQITNGQTRTGLLPRPETRQTRNRFGFFGQMVDVKGVWLLLQAVQLLRAEGFVDFVVEINGDNLNFASEARRQEIEAFLSAEADLPFIERIVTFNGGYEMEHLEQRMARVDWCVVPSVWWEIFALVISEAMMFRRPVIASHIGGPGERIQNGVNGLHFQSGDARALARTIKRAATEEGLWDSLVSGVVDPPSRETMVAEFMALYRVAQSPSLPALKTA